MVSLSYETKDLDMSPYRELKYYLLIRLSVLLILLNLKPIWIVLRGKKTLSERTMLKEV